MKISNLKKSYKNRGENVEVFSNLSAEIDPGEFVAIFGPNGCGKTTLLNIIANSVAPDGGAVIYDKERMDTIKIGYVFQDYRHSLFPWLKVKNNIAFPLKLRGVPKMERHEKVRGLCEKFGCTFDLDVYPYQLSGGQQQFASLLRGLIISPDIYLLDEPFSSLDYQTRLFMLEKLVEIWGELHTTTIFVSHDIDEAIFLAQKVLLLSNKPTKVVKTLLNPLPYPRQISLIGTPEFAEMKKEILSIYAYEIMPSQALLKS